MVPKKFYVVQRRTQGRGYLPWLVAAVVAGCSTSNDAQQAAGGAKSGATEDNEIAGTAGSVMGGDTSSSTVPDEPSPGPVTCRTTGDGITTLVLVNGCAGPLSVRGSNGVAGELLGGEHLCVELGTALEPLSSLRYWGFMGEDPGSEHYTLAEFTFNTDFHDFDWYNLSHVDAHNLPMQIVPIDTADCRTLTCSTRLLGNCPAEGLYRDSSGTVVACVSPDRNNADSPVAQYFEASCSDAYSWSGDDAESMVACAGEDYDVVFCP
jgi:hypothetical protein